jgi:hypothetical protein
MSLPTISGLKPPSSPLLGSILDYLKKHVSVCTMNHSIRPVYFMLLAVKKLPPFQNMSETDLETAMISILLHDLGWATTKELISKDTRFEVNGAQLAVKFIQDNLVHVPDPAVWTQHRLETLWTSIAMHTTPSISAHHPNPIIPIANMAIGLDFFGPYESPLIPAGIMTEEEYMAIVKEFPKENLKEEMIEIMCSFVREKPMTTADNFVAHFGLKYGVDGKGNGKDQFGQEIGKFNLAEILVGSLHRLVPLEEKVGGL